MQKYKCTNLTYKLLLHLGSAEKRFLQQHSAANFSIISIVFIILMAHSTLQLMFKVTYSARVPEALGSEMDHSSSTLRMSSSNSGVLCIPCFCLCSLNNRFFHCSKTMTVVEMFGNFLNKLSVSSKLLPNLVQKSLYHFPRWCGNSL